jgi:hypothetical protein
MSDIKEEDFPGNSLKSKTAPPKKKVKRVVKGRAIKRKKSLGGNLAKSFLGDSAKNVGAYILHEVLIPSAKSMIQDMITNGIEMFLYGESGGPRRKHRDGYGGSSIVSYDRMYNADGRNRNSPRRIEPSRNVYSVRSRGIEEIIIEDRGEAEDVLSSILTLLEEYEVVTVGDVYDLAGFDNTDWTNNTKWGWFDLRSARILKVREGYALDLPDPVSLS